MLVIYSFDLSNGIDIIHTIYIIICIETRQQLNYFYKLFMNITSVELNTSGHTGNKHFQRTLRKLLLLITQ